MKLRIVFGVVGVLLMSINCYGYLYSSDFRFQESLDLEHKRFYVVASDYYRLSDRNEYESRITICSYSFKDGSIRRFYKAKRPVTSIRYLPDTGQVSFLTSDGVHVVNDAGVKVDGFWHDSEESFIAEYVWNHDRTKVAYVVAVHDPEEGKPGPPYQGAGIWIYDFDKGERTRIAERGRYLETDMDREVLYFRTETTAYKYDFVANKLAVDTNMKLEGLSETACSPDRRYCAFDQGMGADHGPYESIQTIFDNENNRQLTPEELVFMKGINAVSIHWGASSKYMTFNGRTEKWGWASGRSIYFFDFEKKAVVEKIKGYNRLIGISPDRSTICIYDKNEDRFFMKEFPKE